MGVIIMCSFLTLLALSVGLYYFIQDNKKAKKELESKQK